MSGSKTNEGGGTTMSSRRGKGVNPMATEDHLVPGLPTELIKEVKGLLDQGQRLPDEFRDVLFENKREVSLTYSDKEREADVLANTMAVPLQRVKSFGRSAEELSNMLIFGDNLQVLKTLLQMKNEGRLVNADGSHGVRLCYIDPPFATRREFTGSQNEKAYGDKVVGAQFVEFLRKRLILIRDLLTDDGSLYVHLDEKKSHYIKVVLDEVFGEGKFEREIVWRIGWVSGYKTAAANWIRNHDVVLFYRKGAQKVFNKEYLPYPKGYTRRDGSLPKGKGVPLEDTWNCNSADILDSIQIMSFSGEKTGFPTQKNENLVARIVKASSNPGDLVLDAFVGSGTTAAVAERLGRRWIGIDSGKLAIYTTQKRLLKLGADKKSLSSVSPFTVYNAGLYDFNLVRDLPWGDFRAFALKLFQCKDERHDVGKINLDGYMGLDHVLVYDFMEHPEAAFDESYIRDLHEAIGDKVGRRFFIVAPAASVSFLQDYIEFDSPSGAVRYYVLRIPYSVIAEIHRRGFSSLQQPISESAINATVEAVGFDFIQPPEVETSVSISKSEMVVNIDEFSTDAMTRAAGGPTGLDALAMVLVDFDFDGEVFDLDDVYYADDLRKTQYSMRLPVTSLGKQVMLIYLDIYGNEHSEMLTVKRAKRVEAIKGA